MPRKFNYDGICGAAKKYANRLNYPVDWRDLAHEVVVKQLRGKNYAEGAMKDYVRRRPLFGRAGHTYQHRYRMVSVETPAASCIAGARPSEYIIMPRLSRLIDGLPPSWKEVIRLRFWGNLHHDEIAKLVGVTQSRVTQIETAAIKRLKESVQ